MQAALRGGARIRRVDAAVAGGARRRSTRYLEASRIGGRRGRSSPFAAPRKIEVDDTTSRSLLPSQRETQRVRGRLGGR